MNTTTHTTTPNALRLWLTAALVSAIAAVAVSVVPAAKAATASLSVSPSSLSFGNENVGTTSATRTVTIQNTSLTTATFSAISVNGDFARSDGTCGSTLTALRSCTITIVFKPTATGNRTGTLSISDNASHSPQTVSLSGTGVGTTPVASVSPSSLTFAGQAVGTTSSAQVVTLTNTGNATMTISSLNTSGDFSRSATTCGSTLAAGKNCTISVAFAPTAAGTRSGSLSIADNAAGSPQSVGLSGTGTAPAVSFTPSSLTFAGQALNTTSSAQTVTVKNTGTAPLSISSVTPSGDYAVASQTCTASAVAAGASCAVNVTFKPTATGSRTGNLSFSDNVAGSPQTVGLSGTGTAAAVSLSPTSLTFASQTLNTASAAQSITVTNTGTASLTVSAVSASGDFAVASQTCTGTAVAPAGTCTVNVTFTPTATGTRTGSISLTDNAAGSPQSATLTGTGIAPVTTVTVTPTSLTFASTVVGASSTAQTATLKNTGTTTANISSVALTGGTDFKLSSGTCGSTLAAGASCTESVTFSPASSGTRTDTLSFADTATGSPQKVALSGTAVAPATLSVAPTSQDFGSVQVGAASAATSFTVTNTGGVASGTLTATVAGAQFAGSADTCSGKTLAAAATCTISVTFNPISVGATTGSLTVSGTPGGQAAASLAGTGTAASSTCQGGSTVETVAHEDDSILFLSPDMTKDIASGRCVETIFLTAGDDGLNSTYWTSREKGVEAAYAEIAGVANQWTVGDAGIAGHPIPRLTLVGKPTVTLAFMRLPDGNVDGSGFPSTGNVSLQGLWQGTISSLTTVDSSSSYTKTDLINTLSTLIQAAGADKVLTQDFTGVYKDGDHSDHHSTGYFTQAAGELDPTPHTLVGYVDYGTASMAANLSDTDTAAKQAAWFAYAPFDMEACQTPTACAGTEYALWWAREYVAATVQQPTVTTLTNVAPQATVTASTEDSTTGQLAVKAVDGSADGYPGDYSHEWATLGEGAGAWLNLAWSSPQTLTSIVLNDRPNTNDQITGGTITFSDGSTIAVPSLPNDGTPLTLTFAAKTVTSLKLTVTSVSATTQNVGLAEIQANTGSTGTPPPPPPAGTNVASLATVAASSETTDTGQLAVNVIDGSPEGYPGDYSHEWATLGEGAGAWVSLTWTTPQTLESIVLNDRPNLNDQITGGTITFSDGSSITVPSLPNDGTSLTLTFPAKTVTSLKLTVTSVSGTTQNIGLAEIQAIT